MFSTIPVERSTHPWQGVGVTLDDSFYHYPDDRPKAASLQADLTISPLTFEQVAEFLDVFRCSGSNTPMSIQWNDSGGSLTLYRVSQYCADWVAEWITGGTEGIEYFLRVKGDPRFEQTH
jgi:hypothetical protein